MCSVAPKLFYVVPDGVCIGWACDVAPKIVFLACGLGGFRLVSRWCLGLFASAVSRWCLHRLGMCSVAPVFWLAVWMVFGSFCICSVQMVFA